MDTGNKLDKKLEEKVMEAVRSTIWINKIDDIVRKKVHPDWFTANGQTFTFGVDIGVDLIKQAFIDAGWEQKVGDLHGVRVVADPSLMTGQEWYDRFEKEIHKPWTDEEIVEPQHSADEQLDFYTAEHVIEAAKKAAGIE